jgi:hypothetical protein
MQERNRGRIVNCQRPFFFFLDCWHRDVRPMGYDFVGQVPNGQSEIRRTSIVLLQSFSVCLVPPRT